MGGGSNSLGLNEPPPLVLKLGPASALAVDRLWLVRGVHPIAQSFCWIKGDRRVDINNSFVAIDLETANSFRGSVCELGLVRIVDGVVDETFTSLFRPHTDHAHFDAINISIHGIRPAEVRDSPEFVDMWPSIQEFIGELPLVAHNAAFDTGALRELFSLYEIPVPSMDYFCTLVMSRRLLDLVSYSLPFVAKDLGIALSNHHRANSDALCAAEVALAMLNREGQSNLCDLAEKLQIAAGHFDAHSWFGSRANTNGSGEYSRTAIEAIRASLDANHVNSEGPLFMKRVAFTGGLSSMTRSEAASKVLSVGGEPEVTVTKRTDFLVVGVENGYTIDPFTATTAKFQKAELLRSKGSMIEVLDELTFSRML